jgi:hypothetical protein
MKKVPLPLQVFGGGAVLALLLSGAWGLLRGEDLSLVLEPADREDAVRLGTLDEHADDGVAPPVLPSVPTLPPGTTLARAHRGGASAEETGDDLSAEMRLLSEARRTMPEDPGAALALLDQHRERYPEGALREEREAYSILILRRLDRTNDAERRYVDFFRDFPGSAFLAVLSEEAD